MGMQEVIWIGLDVREGAEVGERRKSLLASAPGCVHALCCLVLAMLRLDLLRVLPQPWDLAPRRAPLSGGRIVAGGKGKSEEQEFTWGSEEVGVNSSEAGTHTAGGKGSWGRQQAGDPQHCLYACARW